MIIFDEMDFSECRSKEVMFLLTLSVIYQLSLMAGNPSSNVGVGNQPLSAPPPPDGVECWQAKKRGGAVRVLSWADKQKKKKKKKKGPLSRSQNHGGDIRYYVSHFPNRGGHVVPPPPRIFAHTLTNAT